MKYKKIHILFYFLILCLVIIKINAKDVSEDGEKNKNIENTGDNNEVGNKDDEGNTEGNDVNNNDKNNNNNNDTENKNNNNNDENNNKDGNGNNDENNDEENGQTNKSKEEEEMERSCSSSIGNILFQKPNSKSIIVPYSNFTIIWYYDNREFSVRYPSHNITLMLFKSEDANYNDYMNAWKNPIYTRTIPVSEIQPGPERLDGKPVYQWDWDTNFYIDDGFTQHPGLNEQYKFRIIGDGKDIITNKDHYECYVDGDLTPGSTSSFYIVKNNPLGLNYKPLVIENGSSSNFRSTKIFTTIFISIIICLLLI